MAEGKITTVSSKLARWRTTIQTYFLFIWIFPFIRIHTVCSPVFHCYACPLAAFGCPIGVIAQFSALHLFPFLAVGTIIVAGAIFGSFICGYACPFGFLQDLVGRIPTHKFHLPKWTGYLRYVVLLGLVVMVPFFFGEGHPLFICRVCPAGALEAALPAVARQAIAGETVSWPNALKTTILLLFLLAMFVKVRPWCRILCPLGAIFGLFNKFSAVYMRLDTDKCNECRLCEKKCRYGVIPERELQSANCIRCMECADLHCGAFAATSIFNRKKAQPPDPKNESITDEK